MRTTTRLLGLAPLAIALLTVQPALAQIAPANAAGVSMGHLHYVVRDVEANKAFWVALGGTAVGEGPVAMVRFPHVVVLLSEGKSSGGTNGSVVNHVAFRVESIAALEAQGFEMPQSDRYPGIASVYTPEGERVELFDDRLATNIGFEQASGRDDPVAERHNEPLTAPIVTHHIHFYIPESQVEAAQDWYVEHFGATPGLRWQYAAADLPGMNFNFSAGASEVQAPTRGRMLDHIGFEVENLEAFCRTLEAQGVELDRPYTRLPSGLATAFLTDPWGTYIELTEGLAELAGE